MDDFDNYSNTNRGFDEFYNNNQNPDRHSDYNNNSNYNNAFFYGNYNNNSSYSSNSVYNNNNFNFNNKFNNNYNNNYNNNVYPPNSTYNNRNYANNYNKVKNKNSKKDDIKTAVLVLAFLGSVILIVVLDAMSSNTTNPEKAKQLEQIIMYIFFGIFASFGFGVLIFQPINRKLKSKRCKHLVKATIVGYKNHYNRRRGYSTFSPKYEFSYMGKIYQVTESSSRNFALPSIGSQVDMLINENDPYDFYINRKNIDLGFLIFGFLFASVGVWGIISNFFGMLPD